MTKRIKSIITATAGAFVCALSMFAFGAISTLGVLAEGETDTPVESDVIENSWITSPEIVQWTAGKFDPDVNLISAEPEYGEVSLTVGIYEKEGDNYRPITVTSESESGQVITTDLDEIEIIQVTVDDSGFYPYQITGEDAIAAINTLDIGTYYLHVEVAQSHEDVGAQTYVYGALDEYVEFNILKANAWVRTPSIAAWAYGGFVADQNIIIAEPLYFPTIGETDPNEDGLTAEIKDRVHFSVLDQNGDSAFGVYTDEDGTSVTIALDDIDVLRSSDAAYKEHYQVQGHYAEALNSLNAGNYILRAWVNADDEYGYLDYENDIPFRVFLGYNSWVKTPSIIRWEYGSFDRDVNIILADVKYSMATDTRDEFITFTINKVVMVDGSETSEAIDGLLGFHINANGTVGEEQANVLSKLDAGEYELTVEVEGSDNYYPLDPVTVKFDILQAENSWTSYPSVEAWKVDEFNSARNTPVAVAKFGTAVIVITDADTGEEVYYDSANGIDRLNEMRPDSYLVTATVEGNDNYDGLSVSFLFRVFTSDEIVEGGGMPWWGVLLIVVGALAVVAGVLAILHVKGVLSMFTSKMLASIRAKADIDATISAVRAGKITAYAQHTMLMLEAEEREKQAALDAAAATDAPALDAAPTKEEKKAEKEAAALNAKADALENKAQKLKSKSAKKPAAEKKAEELQSQADVVRDIAGARKEKAKKSGTAKAAKTEKPIADKAAETAEAEAKPDDVKPDDANEN